MAKYRYEVRYELRGQYFEECFTRLRDAKKRASELGEKGCEPEVFQIVAEESWQESRRGGHYKFDLRG
jgi:hypothetical protein